MLWPTLDRSEYDGQPMAATVTRSFWAAPSVANPTLLIPADSVAAARQAVGRYHDGKSVDEWARSLSAEMLLRFGPLGAMWLRHRHIELPAPSTTPRFDLISELADRLNTPDLCVAIGLARPKSNRKPILQLLDRRGTCHGWAKVAWNDWTERLVDNEADWLRRLPRGHVVAPTVLHDLTLHGRRVVVVSGVGATRTPSRARDRPPAPEVFEAVAARGFFGRRRVEETLWWRSVGEVIEYATDDERTAIEAVAATVGKRLILVGAWHGDLAPWNVMTNSHRVQLIDWEFAADEAPYGFDLCHFHTQVASELRGQPADEALTYSARRIPHGLARLDIAPADRLVVWRLYLVELIRRTLSLRAAGQATDDVTLGPAALRRLDPTGGNRRREAEAR